MTDKIRYLRSENKGENNLFISKRASVNMNKLESVLLVFYVVFCMVFITLPFVLPATSFVNGFGVTGTLLVKIFKDIVLYIDSPLNTTYNFRIGEPYVIPLTTHSDNPNIDQWWYTLIDLRHNITVYENVSFIPSTYLTAVRWSNKLIVYANDTPGLEGNASVIFYVSVPNSAPRILYLPQELFACEGSFFLYPFMVSDVDEDNLFVDISPKDPFFVFPSLLDSMLINYTVNIASVVLRKSHVGFYIEVVSVSDGQYADNQRVNITVLEINHAPIFAPVGAHTVWSRGDGRVLDFQIYPSDVEDGNWSNINFTYMLNFSGETPFFSINSSGAVYWTANETYLGVHNISVCVIDQGLRYLHPNRSICSETGLNKTTCSDFSVTVTNENRPPYFTYYLPVTQNVTVSVFQNLTFEVGTRDPDGTIPDIYWYIDDRNYSQYTSGNSTDIFTYQFNCSEPGNHIVKVDATDGLLNATHNWTVIVDFSACPTPPPSGGGGGGGGSGGGAGGPTCIPMWVCADWFVCQNLDLSFRVGNISKKDYDPLLFTCTMSNLTSDTCGYQLRLCKDLKGCGTNLSQPSLLQSCYFTEYPSCFDGIRNCHDGGCEVLTDCGGPCSLCPTCSDGVRNQGEEGVDCGGPCPFRCGPEGPSRKKIRLNYALILITLLLLSIVLIIIIKVVQIVKMRKEAKNLEWYRLR